MTLRWPPWRREQPAQNVATNYNAHFWEAIVVISWQRGVPGGHPNTWRCRNCGETRDWYIGSWRITEMPPEFGCHERPIPAQRREDVGELPVVAEG
jgi:hypothetical protein